MRWRLNLMALGAEEAQAVGVNPRWEQLLLIALVTVCTSTSVAAAGIISLYGLFMPHIVRMLVVRPSLQYSCQYGVGRQFSTVD